MSVRAIGTGRAGAGGAVFTRAEATFDLALLDLARRSIGRER